VDRIPRLAPKILRVILLLVVGGVSLSYGILALYSATNPDYPYRLFHDSHRRIYAAVVPKTKNLPIGPVMPTPHAEAPVTLTPPAEVPTATTVHSAPATPTPPSVRESALAMVFPASTPPPLAPAVRPPSPAAAAPRNAHQDVAAPAPLAPAVRPPSAAAAPPRNVHQGVAAPAPPPTYPEFHVQAGAFKQRQYADTLMQELRARGYTVTLVEDSLLRVWVGPAMSRAAAERLAANLRSIGFEAILNPIR
jgi:DedD protein